MARKTKPPFEFNPNSLDAVLQEIRSDIKAARESLTSRLTAQDLTLSEIKVQAIKTNGRVSGLERWKDVITGKTAVIAGGVAAAFGVCGWVIEYFFHR